MRLRRISSPARRLPSCRLPVTCVQVDAHARANREASVRVSFRGLAMPLPLAFGDGAMRVDACAIRVDACARRVDACAMRVDACIAPFPPAHPSAANASSLTSARRASLRLVLAA
eukprot:1436076-Pleurochrysis_carterae.AAC.1